MVEEDEALSPQRRKPVQKICVVGDCPTDTIVLLKEEGIEVVISETGDEYTEDPNIVFLITNFETVAFANLYSNSVGTGQILNPDNIVKARIMGLPYLNFYLSRHMPIPSPQPNRPRYCSLMKDISIVIEMRSSTHMKKRIVDLVHFMGGSARREVIHGTTHLITDAARGKTFRTASALGKIVVRPNFVLDAWARRDDEHFDISQEEFLLKHKLACFEGVRMYLAGFREDEAAEMTKIAQAKQGEIVDHVDKATHVIYCSGPDVHCDVNAGQKQVTVKWFWESVEAGVSINESEYSPGNKKLSRPAASMSMEGVRTSRSSILDSSNTSVLSDGMYSTDDLCKAVQSPIQLDKKYEVVKEMVETEERYIQSLELLIDMRNKLIGDGTDSSDSCWIDRNPSENVTKADVNIIFGKVPPIIAVHKKIGQRLHEIIKHWSKHTQIGKIWLEFMDDFSKVYPPFINSYDTSKQRFNDVDKNEKFHAFVRTCESDSCWRRVRVMDILVRPVQRLPSVNLLLQACLKRCDKNSRDCQNLQKAISTLENVLSKANESRRQAEAYERMMKLFDNIANFPHLYRSGSREHVMECTLTGMGGYFKDGTRKVVRLILFNDLLVLCKVRDVESRNTGGTISRMQRHFSSASLFGVGDDRRKTRLKFISGTLLQFCRQIYAVNTGDPQITTFLLILRDHTGDNECVFGVDTNTGSDAEEAMKFMRTLDAQVFNITGREMILEETDLENLPEIHKEAVMANVFKSSNNQTVNQSFVVPSQPVHKGTMGTFRRAFSNASMSILRPFHRQSLAPGELRQIDESGGVCDLPNGDCYSPPGPLNSSVSLMDCNAATPRRGLRQRITSSSFFENHLSRKGSMRAPSDTSNISHNSSQL